MEGIEPTCRHLISTHIKSLAVLAEIQGVYAGMNVPTEMQVLPAVFLPILFVPGEGTRVCTQKDLRHRTSTFRMHFLTLFTTQLLLHLL